MSIAKPRVEVQGRAVVEPSGAGYLVMLPDGTVYQRATPALVLKVIRAYARAHGDRRAVRALTVEWRDGAEPPAEVRVGA